MEVEVYPRNLIDSPHGSGSIVYSVQSVWSVILYPGGLLVTQSGDLLHQEPATCWSQHRLAAHTLTCVLSRANNSLQELTRAHQSSLVCVPGRDGTSARATCWSQHTACTGGQPARSRTFVAWILLSYHVYFCVQIFQYLHSYELYRWPAARMLLYLDKKSYCDHKPSCSNLTLHTSKMSCHSQLAVFSYSLNLAILSISRKTAAGTVMQEYCQSQTQDTRANYYVHFASLQP